VTKQIDGTIPGELVQSLLTSADPSKPVKASLYITKDKTELRQAVLTGPFYQKGVDSEFTLVLTKYDDNPPVVLPQGVSGEAAT
jgi:lipoprotein LprG